MGRPRPRPTTKSHPTTIPDADPKLYMPGVDMEKELSEVKQRMQAVEGRLSSHAEAFERFEQTLDRVDRTLDDLVRFMHENNALGKTLDEHGTRLRVVEQENSYMKGIGGAIAVGLAALQVILTFFV